MTLWPEQRCTEVAERIYAVEQGRGEAGVSNAAFVIEEGGILLIDATICARTAQPLLREIKRRGRIDFVVNTHHHIDHTGGNAVFADAGARILAHAHTRRITDQLRRRFPVEAFAAVMPRFAEEFATIALPPQAPLDHQSLGDFGAELVVFEAAHTAVDVVVWHPGKRVLVTGDIGFFEVTPLAFDGLISKWISALDHLIALRPEVVIPGHGRIGRVDDLLVVRDYFEALQRLAQEAVACGWSPAEALRQFDQQSTAAWLEPARHIVNLERAIQEARGEVTPGQLWPRPPSVQAPSLLDLP